MESKDAKICPLLMMQSWGKEIEPDTWDSRISFAMLGMVLGMLKKHCIGKTCALYVNAQKISPLGSVMVWEGCGLVHQVAWKFMKPEKKQ